MVENVVDSVYFWFVYNMVMVSEFEEYTIGFFEVVMCLSQKFFMLWGVMEGKIDTHAWGLGFLLVNFLGIVDMLNLVVIMLIEVDCCIVWFSFCFKMMGDEKMICNVGKVFVVEVDK